MIVVFSAILSNKKETNERSYTNRGADIERCIEVGIENPILGVELFHETKEDGSNRNNFGFSNSLFGVFAHGGLYTLSLYILSLAYFPFLYYRRTKDKSLFSVFFCFFVLFTFTYAEYKYITIVFVATGLSLWNVYFISNNPHKANNKKTKRWLEKKFSQS